LSPRLTPALRALLREGAERAEAAGEADREALTALRTSGLLATAVPTEHGGAGRDAAAVNALVEQIAAVNGRASRI
jgi:hypothetical protein